MFGMTARAVRAGNLNFAAPRISSGYEFSGAHNKDITSTMTISSIIQNKCDVGRGLIGLGLYVDVPSYIMAGAVDSSEAEEFRVPFGLDFSNAEVDYEYPLENYQELESIGETTIHDPTVFENSTLFLSPALNYVSDLSFTSSLQPASLGMTSTTIEFGNHTVAPPNTPMLGHSFAEDGGHQEDLLYFMFDEAVICLLPDELVMDLTYGASETSLSDHFD